MFLNADKSYLGATPDQLLGCECCGSGLLEVKCPYSIRHTKPTKDNINYILRDDVENTYRLKKDHDYFAQIQGQLAITKRKWCDFFVYTVHGFFLARIH